MVRFVTPLPLETVTSDLISTLAGDSEMLWILVTGWCASLKLKNTAWQNYPSATYHKLYSLVVAKARRGPLGLFPTPAFLERLLNGVKNTTATEKRCSSAEELSSRKIAVDCKRKPSRQLPTACLLYNIYMTYALFPIIHPSAQRKIKLTYNHNRAPSAAEKTGCHFTEEGYVHSV